MLERTRKECWAIRNRLYPKEVWPSTLHERRVASFGARDGVLLEIGCGRSATQLRRLRPRFHTAVGIDLEVAKQLGVGSGCFLLCADAHHIPLASATVEVIACADVVEHLADPGAFFGECARVLRPGGHLIISTVNKHFPPIVLGRVLPHRVRRSLNRLVSGTEKEDTFQVYYRANTPWGLRRLASAAGLMPVVCQYVAHHPTYFLFSVLVYRVAVYFEQIVRRHESLRFLRHLIQGVFVAPDTADKRSAGPSRGVRARSVPARMFARARSHV